MVTNTGRPQITIAVGPARGKIPLTLWAKISFKAFRVSTKKITIEFARILIQSTIFIWFKNFDSFFVQTSIRWAKLLVSQVTV